jgi:hypothetical protein
MANYEIRLKDAGLESLRGARQRIVDRLGNAKIGDRLVGLDEARAGALANDLLALLDAVEQLLARAKRVD